MRVALGNMFVISAGIVISLFLKGLELSKANVGCRDIQKNKKRNRNKVTMFILNQKVIKNNPSSCEGLLLF